MIFYERILIFFSLIQHTWGKHSKSHLPTYSEESFIWQTFHFSEGIQEDKRDKKKCIPKMSKDRGVVKSKEELLRIIKIFFFLIEVWFMHNVLVSGVSLVQSLSRVRLFATQWIAARQTSLSITTPGVHQNPFPSHPLSSPSPPALNPFQHQGLFQSVSSLHEVAEVLGFQF